MPPTREICKAYYVADVKCILPPNCGLGVENRPICLIIGLSVLAVIFPTRLEPGGRYAHACTVRSQMRQSASARYPEPTSRAGQRCAVSDRTSFSIPAIYSRSNTRCCVEWSSMASPWEPLPPPLGSRASRSLNSANASRRMVWLAYSLNPRGLVKLTNCPTIS